MVAEARYNRQELLFGRRGQEKLEALKVGIVGLGGLGSHVAQQLAYLGVFRYVIVDGDRLMLSNLNRVVGAVPGDLVGERWKVDIVERLIRAVQPQAEVEVSRAWVEDAVGCLEGVDVVVGCVDSDLPRLHLTKLCARTRTPYFDLASDTGDEGDQAWYGGRVVTALGGDGCLSCLGLLDQRAMARSAMNPEQRAEDDRIYGVIETALGNTGPAVVSVNGVVASLGVTELMAWATRLRKPVRHLVYRGEQGHVRINTDQPTDDCYYCTILWPHSSGAAPRGLTEASKGVDASDMVSNGEDEGRSR